MASSAFLARVTSAVRAVSEELGLPITWSSKTNSVFIGKHKTEGLTVENIDSPEVIRDAVNSHFIKKQLPLMLGYVCDNKTYNIISSGLEEYIMTLVFLVTHLLRLNMNVQRILIMKQI